MATISASSSPTLANCRSSTRVNGSPDDPALLLVMGFTAQMTAWPDTFCKMLAWAGKAGRVPGAIRVEDGFLRSRGLGAALTPPLSMVADDLGIYYDPTRESRLERLIAEGPPPGGAARAERLIAAIRKAGLSSTI